MNDVSDLISGGWGAVNKAVEPPTKQDDAKREIALEEQFQIDASYLRCFSTSDGQVVLEDMKERYIFVNSYNPSIVNPDQHGHFLEGHRNMVLTLMSRMERAKLGSPVAKRSIQL